MAELFGFNKFITRGIKVQKDDEERVFTGHISAEIFDKQEEFIAQEEILKTIDTWLECGASISDAHSNRITGRGISYEKSEYEGHPTVKITAKIFNKYVLHDEVWNKIKKGEYGGLSMGGASKERTPVMKDDGTIGVLLKDLEIYEIAVCKSPANPLALIDGFNELAKSSDMTVKSVDGRQIIQCDSVSCMVEKFAGLGARTNVSNENLASQDPPDNKPAKKNTTKYISNKSTPDDMSEDAMTLLVKSVSNQDELIKGQADLIKGQDEKIDALTKKIEELIEKTNPVTEGKTDDTAPKGANGNETGAKVKLSNEYQGKSEQSGINHQEESPAVPNKVKLTKEDEEEEGKALDKPKKPADEVKKEKDAEQEEDTEDGAIKDEKKPDNLKKSFENGYEFEKTETPRPTMFTKSSNTTPTGWDVIKAVENGWGKHTTPEDSLKEMNQLFNKGSFGSGLPGGSD